MLRIIRWIGRSLSGGPDSRVDGKLTVGDIRAALFAMVAMTITLTIAGAALELLFIATYMSHGPYSWRGLLLGFSFGALIGALGAFLRVALDLTYRPSPPIGVGVSYSIPDQEQEDNPPVAPVTLGVKVWVEDKRVSRGQVLMTSLLPKLERIQAAKILRKVAIAVIHHGENFSKRQAGRFLPDDSKTEVKDEFLRLGFLVKGGPAQNSPLTLTELGLAFFELCLEEPFPPDPLKLYIE